MIVVIVLLAAAYSYLHPLFQGKPPTLEKAFDPDRVFVVKALVKSPSSGKEYFDYFIKVDGDTWFEVYSEPSFTTRFMFKLVSVSRNELVLRDDTRNPKDAVTLRINFDDKKIYYRLSNEGPNWIPLHDIVRYNFAKG